MTIYIVTGFLPMFLLAPFAGVWADRHDRKKLIVFADAGIALVTLVLAILFFRGIESMVVIMCASALRAFGSAVHQPAIGSILPQFVPTDRLMRVNGIYGSLESIIGLGAPIIAAFLMTFSSLPFLFLIDVVTASIAIAFLYAFVKVPPHSRSQETLTSSQWEDLLEGFRYIRSHRYLIPFFLYLATVLILITPAAFLTPLQAKRTYGDEVWRLSAIEVAFSLGMLIGGAILAAWGGFKNRMWSMLLATMTFGLCTIVLGFAPLFPIYIGAMGIFGIALAFYETPNRVILQEHVSEEYLGRIYSVDTMLLTSMMPLAMLLFGPLAEIVAIESLLLVTGGLMVLLALLVPLHKNLMGAGKAPEQGS